jgi:hypothetical protein
MPASPRRAISSAVMPLSNISVTLGIDFILFSMSSIVPPLTGGKS